MAEPMYTVEQVRAYEKLRREEGLFKSAVNIGLLEETKGIRADNLHKALDEYEMLVQDDSHREPLIDNRGIKSLRSLANDNSTVPMGHKVPDLMH